MYTIKILRETIINIFVNFIRTKKINTISRLFYNVSFIRKIFLFIQFYSSSCSLITEQFNNNIQLRFNPSKEILHLMPCFISSHFLFTPFRFT